MTPRLILVGVIVGLLVGGLHNAFTVPVMERAIEAEELAAAQRGEAHEEPAVSLGAQRVGLAVGTAIFGAVLGALFAGIHAFLRRFAPHRDEWALAALAGGAGFWALSLFPFLKYPLNPPGVGEPETLTFRQGFQVLFMALALGLTLALAAAAAWWRRRGGDGLRRNGGLAALALLYAGAAAALYFGLPDSADPITMDMSIVRQFRALAVTGHLLLWALIAGGALMVAGRRVPAMAART